MSELRSHTLTRYTPRSPLFAAPPSWAADSACAEADPELFYAPDNERDGALRDRRVAAAKAICATCEVRAECLVYAYDTRQSHGVWGGLDEHERRTLATRRKDPRP